MTWENAQLLYTKIMAPVGKEITVSYGALKKAVSLKPNEIYKFVADNSN